MRFDSILWVGPVSAYLLQIASESERHEALLIQNVKVMRNLKEQLHQQRDGTSLPASDGPFVEMRCWGLLCVDCDSPHVGLLGLWIVAAGTCRGRQQECGARLGKQGRTGDVERPSPSGFWGH